MSWNKDFPSTQFSIQRQYANTNIHELLNGIAKVRGVYKRQAIDTFKNDVRNLKTAVGDALDMWGKILGFSRHIPLNTGAGTTYREFSFWRSYFKQLQFGRIDKDDYLTLPDASYRFLLLLLLQGRRTDMKIRALNDFAQELFSMIGLNCAVFDNFEMKNLSYVVDDVPPLWLTFVLKNYDLLPRPAGVGAELLVDRVLPIGFYRPPPNPPASNLKITNFYYSKFQI